MAPQSFVEVMAPVFLLHLHTSTCKRPSIKVAAAVALEGGAAAGRDLAPGVRLGPFLKCQFTPSAFTTCCETRQP